MDITLFANKAFALSTIVAQLFLAALLVYLVLMKVAPSAIPPALKKFFAFVAAHGLWLAFLTVVLSMAGSLFYSQVAGFPPCELCWYQRIFMYPLALVLLIGLIKRDSRVFDYALALAIVGGAIALFHNYIYYSNGGLNVICQFGGIGISCTKRYVFEFNYVTIPLMSLTAFGTVIAFLLFHKFYAIHTKHLPVT